MPAVWTQLNRGCNYFEWTKIVEMERNTKSCTVCNDTTKL